eukprot:GEMP01046496.1.p1 GENE.GEMP01046496.1~~GEMP01046496.1.p1  ORF type:complete len:289 (+),score=55.57 GEMP01046496.1:77-943(+)
MSREWHVQSLRQKVPAAQQGEDSTWKIKLVQPSMEPICTIVIELTSHFPQQKPRVSVKMAKDGACRHPWVGADGIVIGSDDLNLWERNQNRDLGNLAASVMQEFASRPPTYGEAAQTSARTTMPAIPTNFPDLNTMTEEELEYYDNNPDVTDDYWAETDLVHKYKKILNDLYESNAKIASTNLEMENQVVTDQTNVQNKYMLHHDRKAEVEELMAKENEITQRFHPDYLFQQVREIAALAQKDADEYLDDVLEGKQELSKKYFMEKKKKLHRIIAQKEKLGQMHSERR